MKGIFIEKISPEKNTLFQKRLRQTKCENRNINKILFSCISILCSEAKEDYSIHEGIDGDRYYHMYSNKI